MQKEHSEGRRKGEQKMKNEGTYILMKKGK